MYNGTRIGEYSNRIQEIELYYRSWIPVSPKGLVLFIHGAGEHSGGYSHIGSECVNRQIGFMAPDLRGFGKSGGQRGHIYRFKEYLDDLDQLIILLQTRYQGLPIYLCGHSLGGLIAIRFAQQFSDKATGVILSSPALGFHLPSTIRKCVDLISLLTPALPLDLIKWNESLRRRKWLQSRLPAWTSELLDDPFATIQYTPRWFAELFHNGAKALSETYKFHFPTICFYDRLDPVVNSDLIEQFIQGIVSEDKTCAVFSEGNHNLLRDEKLLQQIFQWLSSRLN
ncbi:MAG: serine aminopeptidase [Paenibacillus sp.]|nr:serine aminopeptidase [Paenibacillus sp.]